MKLPSRSALSANLSHILVNDKTIKMKLYKLSSPESLPTAESLVFAQSSIIYEH